MLVSRLIAVAALSLVGATGSQDAWLEKAEALLERAVLRYEQGRYDEAVRIYRDLARKFPGTEAASIGERRSRASAYIGSKTIVDNGPSENRVDVALMGDGYTLEHQRAWDELAEDIPRLFERQATFREYASYLNFVRLNLVSKDDKVDGFGREEDTALDGRTLNTYAGHVGVDHRLVHAMLDELESHDDLAIVFVRTGVLGTGGGGVAVIGGRSAPTTVHEWGHAFGGLGDEYSTKTHERGGVSERPNVSRTDDPEQVPWAHWIAAKVPGIGTYEGASGQVRDAWKPTASGCVMLSGEFFCKPCREALVLRIYSLVDPFERTSFPVYPLEHRANLRIRDRHEFEVEVMQPASHPLEVRWWMILERAAPPPPRRTDARYATTFRDRRDRGPLPVIATRPDRLDRFNRTGLHEFTVKARDYEPGRYRLICRARDTTLLRGEKFPWVLKDEHGVLESERAWWIEIVHD